MATTTTTINNVRSWATDIDSGTLLQAEKTARSPAIHGHVALMPDAHVGIGSTIGSVIPTMDTIIPAAVGVDIGCGMIGVQTDLEASDLPDSLDGLHSEFARSIPSGVGRRHSHPSSRAQKWLRDHPLRTTILNNPSNEGNVIASQLGSLGSGNHFTEVCLDEGERVWVILHSGSRGIGNKLAMQHIKLAKKQEQGLEDPDLAYFTQGTPEFQAYISDMLWAQDYALENREIMMDAALNQLFRYVGKGQEVERNNCHHNFAAQEEHFGKTLWITRKGAIRARVGDWGIIPGSMATGSFIIRGKGELTSYTSCAHGAGRRMSRGQAKRELSVESLREAMAGKAWNSDQPHALVDEHPQAYKDIGDVMADQADLVTVIHTLHQELNYKGV